MLLPTHLGQAIRTLRRRRGLTQRHLARRSGLSTQRISRYERGVRQPPFGVLDRLLGALGSDLGELHGVLLEAGHRNGVRPVEDPRPFGRRLAEIQDEVAAFKDLLGELSATAAQLGGNPRSSEEPAPTRRSAPLPLRFQGEGSLERWIVEPAPAEPLARNTAELRGKARELEASFLQLQRQLSLTTD